MEFIAPELEDYATRHTAPEPVHLQRLAEATHRESTMPRMLSGHLQGRFLSLLSHLVRPDLVLDIGTFTGYSALCMAEGLSQKGHLHSIDVDTRHSQLVENAMAEAGYAGRITLHQGHALDLIPSIPGIFDLVFIDADKENYPQYLAAMIDRVRPGGLIVADNVLWSGKVLPPARQDQETQGLVAYAEKVKDDQRLESILLPVRDGLLISRRK